jgi:hypothetical protein
VGGAGTNKKGWAMGKAGMGAWPTPLPTSVLWGAAPSGFTGSPISQWVIPAGMGFAGGPSAAGALRPAVGSINGLAAADYDGVDDLLTIGGELNGAISTGEVWAVVHYDDLAAPGVFTILLNGPPLKFLFLGTLSVAPNRACIQAFHDGVLNNAVKGDTVLATGAPYVMRFVSTGSAWRIQVNGHEETLTVLAGSNAGNWYSLVGAANASVWGSFDGASNNLDGRMAFWMDIQGAVLGETEANQWSRFLCGAFGATYLGA